MLSFDDIIGEYLADKKASVKPQSYDREVVLCNHVSRLIGKIVIAKLTAFQYESFRSALLDSDYSVTYKNKIDKQLKSLIEYAYKKHDIRNDIPKKYKSFTDPAPKKEMKIYTLEEFNVFIEYVPERFKPFFQFLMFTGARLNEANALQWNDIDFEKRTAKINKSIVMKTKSKDGLFAITTPKTPAANRIIPLPELVLNSLKTLHDEQQNDADFTSEYFCFGGRRPLPETSITKAKDAAVKASGLHRIRIHDFRHSFASMLVNNLGVDNILLISKLLGHGSIQETLKTYSHLWNSAFEGYLKTFDERFANNSHMKK